MNDDPFEVLRSRLIGIAYRILGTMVDAEDVVQDTWIAWHGTERDRIASTEAYLVRSVTNGALNRLRTRERRREAYAGPWLPEPVDAAHGPDEAAELADSVSYAMLVLLEQLSPLERAAFVLRDVFAMSAVEVGEALGRSPAAVRQLVARARARLDEGRVRYPLDPRAGARQARAFVAALGEGDLTKAVTLLAPDVELVTDGGGRVKAAMVPIIGAEKVVRFFSGLITRYGSYEIRPIDLNHAPAFAVRAGDEVSVVQFGARNERITHIWVTRNPDKLRHVDLGWR